MGPPEVSQSTSMADDEQTERSCAPPGLKSENDDKQPSSRASEEIQPVATNALVTSHGEHAISLREVDPVSVRLERLSVSVDQSPNLFTQLFSKNASTRDPNGSHVKKILDDISAECKSGTLTAIIGGSGSGKTSLLNQMSGRMTGNRLSVSGRTLFNGREDASRIRSAYVIQVTA